MKAKKGTVLRFLVFIAAMAIGLGLTSCDILFPDNSDPDSNTTSESSDITISGTLNIPNTETSVREIRLVLHTQNWNWKELVVFPIAESSADWSTTIKPFDNQTTIYFQIEAFENHVGESPVFAFGVNNYYRIIHNKNVSNVNIDISNIQLIELKGTIESVPFNQVQSPWIALQVGPLTGSGIFGQASIQNTGGVLNWVMNIQAQAFSTNVKFNIYGFNDAALWEGGESIFDLMDVIINDCLLVYNENKNNIKISLKWSARSSSGSSTTISLTENEEGIVKVDVGGVTNSDDWRARASYHHFSYHNKEYIYKFWARTETGNRSMSVQHYYNPQFGWRGERIDINEDWQEFIIYGDLLPSNYAEGLVFNSATQLGTFYIKDVSIEEYEPVSLSITGTNIIFGRWRNDPSEWTTVVPTANGAQINLAANDYFIASYEFPDAVINGNYSAIRIHYQNATNISGGQNMDYIIKNGFNSHVDIFEGEQYGRFNTGEGNTIKKPLSFFTFNDPTITPGIGFRMNEWTENPSTAYSILITKIEFLQY